MYKEVLASLIILFSLFLTYDLKAAASVEMRDVYGYLDEFGYYVVIGEVVNVDSTPIHFVEIIVTFLDKDRELLYQLPVSAALETIHPGQTSPFEVTLRDTEDAALVRSYEVEIGDAAPTTSKESKLSVIFHKLEISENTIVVSGRIVNDGVSVSTNTKAMVVLYDIIGEPLRFSAVFTDPIDILAFASGVFSVSFKVDDTANLSGYAISSESSWYRETERFIKVEVSALERVLEVISISNLFTLDVNNQAKATVKVEDPVLVKLNITNILSERRTYTYILQATDQNGFVSSLSWSMGTLTPEQSYTTVIAWVPQEPGMYILEAFVWKSVEDPVPLAFRTIARNLQVR